MASKEIVAVYLWGAWVCAYTAWYGILSKKFWAGGPFTGRAKFWYTPGPILRYTTFAVGIAGFIYTIARLIGMLKSN